LSTFAKKHDRRKPNQWIVNLVRHPKEEIADDYYLYSKIGQLWLQGTKIDWSRFYVHEERRRIQLPTYPFERQRFWIEGSPYKQLGAGTAPRANLDKRDDVSDWFYIPSWKRPRISLPEPGKTRKPFHWLLFVDQHQTHIASRLLEQLKQLMAPTVNGNSLTLVFPGSEFASLEDSNGG
ncbi:MAG: hypothetical protein GY940_09905, partial [bacterium]|nr:hypothetical protein [bacterium]